MATARPVYAVNVCAFIMTHGIVTPKKTPAVQPVGLQPTHYTVTATPLPANITLYAPAILGYSYYEDKQTENIVTRAARSLQRSDKGIAETFLHYLREYVNYKISRLNRYLCLVDLPHGDDRTERLEKTRNANSENTNGMAPTLTLYHRKRVSNIPRSRARPFKKVTKLYNDILRHRE
jgi:hypothetical protein